MFNDPHLKLSIVGSEECVQRSILHELGDYHDWIGLGYDTLKKNPQKLLILTTINVLSEQKNNTHSSQNWHCLLKFHLLLCFGQLCIFYRTISVKT